MAIPVATSKSANMKWEWMRDRKTDWETKRERERNIYSLYVFNNNKNKKSFLVPNFGHMLGFFVTNFYFIFFLKGLIEWYLLFCSWIHSTVYIHLKDGVPLSCMWAMGKECVAHGWAPLLNITRLNSQTVNIVCCIFKLFQRSNYVAYANKRGFFL